MYLRKYEQFSFTNVGMLHVAQFQVEMHIFQTSKVLQVHVYFYERLFSKSQ